MIAEKPDCPSKANQAVPQVELFAGMSFPTVPTGPINIKSKANNNAIEMTTNKSINIDEDIDIVVEESFETSCLIPRENEVEITGKIEATNNKTFSALYANEAHEEQHPLQYYPTLPTPVQRMNTVVNPINITQATSSFINSAVLPNAPVERIVPNASLVDELIQENNKLNAEVQMLKKMLQQKTPQSVPASLTTNTNVSTATPNINTAQTSQTSDNSNSNVKYVCCGSCKQWLLAPRTAVYVICTNCQAVNNCNFNKETNLSTSQQQVMQSNESATGFPSFLECFSRAFS